MATKFIPLLGLLGALALFVLAGGCGGSKPIDASAPGASAMPASDADGDGILDPDDKCPDKKEDGVMPNPKDGCPKS